MIVDVCHFINSWWMFPNMQSHIYSKFNTKPHQSHRGALRRNGKIVLVTLGNRVVVQKRWDAVLTWFYDTETRPSTPSGMHKSCKSWDKPTITVTAGFQASSLDDVNSQRVQLHSHKRQDAPSVFPTMITWYTWSSFAILTTNMKPTKPELACSQTMLPCDFCKENMCIARIVTHKNLDPHAFWCVVSPALFVHASQILRPIFFVWYVLRTKCYHKKNWSPSSLSVVDTILNNTFYLWCKWLLGFRWPSCKWFLSTPGGSFAAGSCHFFRGKSSTKL